MSTSPSPGNWGPLLPHPFRPLSQPRPDPVECHMIGLTDPFRDRGVSEVTCTQVPALLGVCGGHWAAPTLRKLAVRWTFRVDSGQNLSRVGVTPVPPQLLWSQTPPGRLPLPITPFFPSTATVPEFSAD